MLSLEWILFGICICFTTLLIAIPSAVKAFNYITPFEGTCSLTLQCCSLLGWFLPLSQVVSGIILGDSTLDINVCDTYFVAHFHLVMGISALYGLFVGVYWFPKMFGRMMNKNLGYVHLGNGCLCHGYLYFIGIMVYQDVTTPTPLSLFRWYCDINVVISLFAFTAGAAQLVSLQLYHSIFTEKQSKTHGNPIPWNGQPRWTYARELAWRNHTFTVGLMTTLGQEEDWVSKSFPSKKAGRVTALMSN